jgi:nudix-type nucleoside diphosphatase (YffH/AdpP family)
MEYIQVKTDPKMNYKIIKRTEIHKGFISLFKVEVDHDTFNGERITNTYEVIEGGDSAAVLLYEKDTNSLLLVRQFRFPTTKNDDGWLLELVAGNIDEGESRESSIQREIEEEIGYETSGFTEIGGFYASPGSSSERIYIYYSEVTRIEKTKEGGGKEEESEDIELIKVPIDELQNMISQHKIKDAKTMLAILWFLKEKL